jgi:drug/metabolite transporter (DMT)-like permease
MSVRNENFGLLLGFAGMLLFAGTLPAARLAVAAIDPWFFTMGRAALAGIVALAILKAAGRPLVPRAHLNELAVAAAGLVFGFPLFSALAMVTVPAAHGGVVMGVLPLATAAAGALLAQERPSLGFWITGLAGACLVIAFAWRNGGPGSLVGGDLLLVAAIVVCAIGYALSGRMALAMPGWEVICRALVLSLPVSLVGSLLSWPADPAAVPPRAWAAFLYVALVAQLIGFFVWNAGLALGGIARVGQMQLLQPFVVVGLAAIVNGEPVDLETLLFAAAVVATVMVGRRMRVRR